MILVSSRSENNPLVRVFYRFMLAWGDFRRVLIS